MSFNLPESLCRRDCYTLEILTDSLTLKLCPFFFFSCFFKLSLLKKNQIKVSFMPYFQSLGVDTITHFLWAFWTFLCMYRQTDTNMHTQKFLPS